MTIEVTIKHKETGQELGRVTIENVETYPDDTADYSVRFAADNLREVGLHQRAMLSFPRLKYNVLGLLLQALNTLDQEELKLHGATGSPDLARRFRRRLPDFPT